MAVSNVSVVEQTGQVPEWGLLFFIVMDRGLLISLLDRHFMQ